MKIDAAGMALPDEPPQPADLRYRCPDCGVSTWPGVDRHGHITPRRCLPCQAAYDIAEEQTHR